MCLAVTNGIPEKTEGFGWKVFQQSKPGAKLYSKYFGNASHPRRQWIRAEESAQSREGNGIFNASENGFHIFVNRQDAVSYSADYWKSDRRFVVRKVRYRSAFLQGTGDGNYYEPNSLRPVVVAKEIYIIEANRA